eukprot:1169833-Rhodomonas_salina.1
MWVAGRLTCWEAAAGIRSGHRQRAGPGGGRRGAGGAHAAGAGADLAGGCGAAAQHEQSGGRRHATPPGQTLARPRSPRLCLALQLARRAAVAQRRRPRARLGRADTEWGRGAGAVCVDKRGGGELSCRRWGRLSARVRSTGNASLLSAKASQPCLCLCLKTVSIG